MPVDHQKFWERVIAGLNAQRFEIFDEVFADDYVEDYPQSGEIIRGRANFRATLEHYPRSTSNLAADTGTIRTHADDAVKLVGPTYTIVKVHGGGDSGVLTMRMRYPDGTMWWVVRLYTLKNGLVSRSTTFFAAEFEPPSWRSAFVERTR